MRHLNPLTFRSASLLGSNIKDSIMSAFKISSIVNPHNLILDNKRFQFGKRTKFVSLAELETDPKEGSSTMGKIIILELLYYKRAPTSNEKGNQFFYSRANPKLSNVSYDRMIVLRCLNSPPGLNICCILMGSSRNGRLFDQHLSVSELCCNIVVCRWGLELPGRFCIFSYLTGRFSTISGPRHWRVCAWCYCVY